MIAAHSRRTYRMTVEHFRSIPGTVPALAPYQNRDTYSIHDSSQELDQSQYVTFINGLREARVAITPLAPPALISAIKEKLGCRGTGLVNQFRL